jgi:hypothetical protein
MSDLFFDCPVCGEDVPRKAKSCPSCGACEKSGWSEDHYLDGIDLPEEDYTTGRRLEGGAEDGKSGGGVGRLWVQVVAAILLIAMLWLVVRSLG